MTYASLSAANKKIDCRATFNCHGLQFSRGNINYNRLNDIIKRALYGYDVYVKSGTQKDFLEKIINGSDISSNIIDMSLDWSTHPTQPSYPKCMEHLPDNS